MENQAMPEPDKKETTPTLTLPLAILISLASAWLVYVYTNQTWLAAFQRVASWLASPTVNYMPVQIDGIPLAFLATVEILILGGISSNTLLADEKDTVINFISALGLGIGLMALITIVLGICWNLFQLQLNVVIILVGAGILLIGFRRNKWKTRSSTREFLKVHFTMGKVRRPSNLGLWLLACFAIGTIFFFVFYHALLTVITHWDATVYHAVMSVIMFNNHGIPVIAGPSIGIEMSANFPPLFSALGAYYYTQIGLIEDFYLRAIPPVMGILTVLATYKIGEVLAGKRYGILSALLLAMTPLFFRYSIFATSYSTLTFFGTVSVLFLFLAIIRAKSRYWISSGVFYGFALLTSYLALYLAPFFVIALIYYFVKEKNGFRINTKTVLLLISSTLVIGGIWYLRNLVLLGNPIYPNGYTVLGGINIDPLIMETTLRGLKRSATAAFFGGEIPLLLKTVIFFTYKTHFPSISLLTILGITFLPTQSKKFWLLSAWPSTLTIVVLSGITWGFPRHIVFALPGFALLSALPILKALEKCAKHENPTINQSKTKLNRTRIKIPFPRKTDLLRMGITVVLAIAFLFPSLTYIMGGKVGMDNIQDEPRENYLWFLENPNAETWLALKNVFPEAEAWEWINDNVDEGEKVATIENRIYYVKNCSNDYFFYLDGWEARYLYNISQLSGILEYLNSENVKYVLDVDWAREHGHFDILPMAQFLGTPFFPKISYDGYPIIYCVWSAEVSVITANSTMPIAISQDGWSEPHLVDGNTVQSVVAGSDSPRFSVVTANLTSVKLTYYDSGTDKLSIYLYNEYSKEWFEYTFIKKTDTREWKTREFLVPVSKKEFTEFALHAYNEDFAISKIEAVPLQAEGKVSPYSLKSEMTKKTSPPTMMVYLPILDKYDRVLVQTNSHGKEICVEVFEGVIEPSETTEWWKHRELAARSPNSIVAGEINPSLVWNVEKTGLYTIVVVLREDFAEDTKVELQISIGGTR
jgi:4-amino-4-deoxy-L-arabinose transferase-like glycosyltransferase